MPDGKVVPEREIRLVQEMSEVQGCLEAIDRRAGRQTAGNGDLIDQANYGGEVATDLVLRRSHGNTLRRLRRAYARLCSGAYDLCESCGAPIHPERLRVLPGATLCIRCQQAAEAS